MVEPCQTLFFGDDLQTRIAGIATSSALYVTGVGQRLGGFDIDLRLDGGM